MPEIRQNIITGEWVVISTERAKRPSQFARPLPDASAIPVHDSNCPFCPGNEALSPGDILRHPLSGTWEQRIISNKFPALTNVGSAQRTINGIYRSMEATGAHEVLIEHPRHDLILNKMSIHEISDIFRMYRDRYRQIRHQQYIESIIIFRNHGLRAGASLVHPHSQIVATPVTPFQVRMRMELAIRYYDDHGECLFCRTLHDELVDGRRIITDTEHFTAFIPYAALSPFHIWIFPKRHVSSFDDINSNEMSDIAVNLKATLGRLYTALGNPDYNFTIRSSPVRDSRSEYFHWYLAIVPRLNTAAGFELGSGMFISSALPEESAAFLRSVEIEV